jgi:carboxymethylenebutenolidase
LGAATSYFPQNQRIPSTGTRIKLTASDGHKFGAYRVDPAGTSKSGIVVIQEIFGVNRHIRLRAEK